MPDDREHHQREDLGVLEALGRRLALGLGAGQRRGLAGEGGDAALEVPLGEEQHAEDGEHQDQQPAEQRRAVDGQGALGHDLAGLRRCRSPGSRSRKTITEVTIAAIRPSSASTTCTT